MPGPEDKSRSTSFRPPPILIGLGVLIIALGFGLPKLFTGGSTFSSSVDVSSRAESLAPANLAPTSPEKPSLAMAAARLAGGLVVVCGLCIVITRWVARRKPVPKGTMEMLASLAVDLRSAVHLVRAGERRLVIGTDMSGVKAVVELPARLPEFLPAPTSTTNAAEVPKRSETVPGTSTVIGPIPVSVPPAQPSRDEILSLLARLRGADSTPKS